MKTLKVGKPAEFKTICFSIDQNQNEKFRKLQSEAKALGIKLTPKKIILGTMNGFAENNNEVKL